MELKVKLDKGAVLPSHQKPGDAGLDMAVVEGVCLAPHETKIVGTGVSVEIPEGYVGLCFPRSGLASKRGITLANSVGVIDSGYRGEIKATLHNMGERAESVAAGERVMQLVIVPFATCECVEVPELSDTERGTGGFGSTGAL